MAVRLSRYVFFQVRTTMETLSNIAVLEIKRKTKNNVYILGNGSFPP